MHLPRIRVSTKRENPETSRVLCGHFFSRSRPVAVVLAIVAALRAQSVPGQVPCGEAVNACIYVMLDRTGSTSPQSLANEGNAAKDFLDFFAAVADAPPVAIGAFGCNGTGFPANGAGHLGYCTGNANRACTLLALSDTSSPAPYGDDDGSTSDGDHYSFVQRTMGSMSSVGTHFSCALDVVNTGLGHGSCPADKKKVLIFLSDGADMDGQNSLNAADHLKITHEVEIFSILFPAASGGPSQAEQDQMRAIASDPKSIHYFLAPDSSDLAAIFDTVAEQIGCDDGQVCTDDFCVNGFCSHTPIAGCCDGDDDCADAAPPCEGGQYCDLADGVCKDNPDAALSTPCEREDPGRRCTVDQCDGNGHCVFLRNVTCSGPSGPCDGGKLCELATGACVDAPDPPFDTFCNVDNNLCSLDHCDGGGNCVNFGNVKHTCAPAVPPCEGGETCNPATGVCQPNPDAPLGTSCERGDPQGLCTIDHCDGSGRCVLKTAVDCADPAPPCEGGQYCDTTDGACKDNADAALSTPCERGDALGLCTVDHCDGLGNCVELHAVNCPGEIPPCEGGSHCYPPTGACIDLPDAAESTPCERGDTLGLCTTDHCDGDGHCVLKTAVDCADAAPPCEGGQYCDPADGVCKDTPDAVPSTPCEADGDLCTIEQCDGAGGCVFLRNVVCPGPTGSCDGGQRCNSATGVCQNEPDAALGTSCERGDPLGLCTVDHCSGLGNCVELTIVNCPDPVPPCEGGARCEPTTGACVNLADAPLSTPCERDNPPNLCLRDHCDGGGNCVILNPITCPGSQGACEAGENCDPATGQCVLKSDPPAGTPCEEDQNLCTIEQCDGLGDCVLLRDVECPLSTGACDAGKSCDPLTGACVDEPDPPPSTPCQRDADLCSHDFCDGNGNCVFLNRKGCPPDTACETFACDPSTGSCEGTPRALGTHCERGDAMGLCTTDHCDGDGHCVLKTAVDCADAAPPCERGQYCDPTDGACKDNPDTATGAPCDTDGDRCTVEQCDGAGGCAYHRDVACPGPAGFCDGGQRCNAANGLCRDELDKSLGTSCERGDPAGLCTVDRCNGLGHCVEVSVVMCADPAPPCESGARCEPTTGACVDLPDAPAGETCELGDPLGPCTIDGCDGSGECVFVGECPGDPAHFCNKGQPNDPMDNECVDCVQGGFCVTDQDCAPERGPFVVFCDQGLDPDDCTDNFCDRRKIIECESDADCPSDPAKCVDSFCDPVDQACETLPIPDCCDRDEHCLPDPAECVDSFCGPTDNACKMVPIPGCCHGDTDCPSDPARCVDSFCDSKDNTCAMLSIPGCCLSDTDCPSDPAVCVNSFCNPFDGACATAPIPGCCDGDEDCPPPTNVCDAGQTCNRTTGACEDLPDPEGTPCLDGLFCTLADVCTGGECRGSPLACPELPCIVAVCDEQARGCVGQAASDGTACDDGYFCTIDDACAGGGCEGQPRACGPFDEPCGFGVCDELADACIVVPRDDVSTCTDDDPCTTHDRCEGGVCRGDRSYAPDAWRQFAGCLGGVGAAISPDCSCFDFDTDGDVDLKDVAEFLLRVAGD